jgi:hypothetical protein
MWAASWIVAGTLALGAAALAAPSAAPSPSQPGPSASGGEAAASAASVILDCSKLATSRLEPLDSFLVRCPGLEGALVAVGFKDSLSEQRRHEINASTLQGLAALADRYQRPMPAPPLHEASLRRVLDQLAGERARESGSLWDSFRNWLGARIGGKSDDAARWLDRWLGKAGSAAYWMTLLTIVMMALVLVGAFVYVYREIKAAQSIRGSGSAGAAGAQAPATVLKPSSLEAAPLFERPAILLRMLISRFVRSGSLMQHRHLTHRELSASLRLDDPVQRGRFADVASLAEQILYGDEHPPADRVERILEEGRALLAKIESTQAGSA